MIRTRTRKILRDVLARRGRTALVSLAIFIGVTGTIALFSMSSIIIGQLQKDIREDQLAMGRVYVKVDEGVPIENARYLMDFSRFPGVTAIMGGLEDLGVSFKVDADAARYEDGLIQAYNIWNGDRADPQLVRVPFDAEMPLEPLRLLEGGAWPAPGANEVVVEQRMADEYGLSVGDPIYFRVSSPSRDPQQNGKTGTTEAWTVTGIVFDPYALTPKESIYTDQPNGNYLGGTSGFGVFWVRFRDFESGQDLFDALQSAIVEQTPYTPTFAQIEDPAKSSLITGAQTLTSLMGFLALVSLVVSGFLVVNVITSLVNEQKRQIGVMKTIGATRFDNFYIYSGIAFVYGLIGVIPGVIVGIPLGNLAAHALAPQVNTVIEGFKISPPSIILGVIVGLLVPVLASLLPVFNGTRVRILDAMTDVGITANYGSGPLAKIIGKLPIPITVRQGLSNVSLKKGRLTFTVITLAVAVGAFMGIYALFATMTAGINMFIDSFNVELAVFPGTSRDPQEFQTLLASRFPEDVTPGITQIEPGTQMQVEFEGYEPLPSAGGPPGIFAYGYDINSPNPAFNFTIDRGEPLTNANKDTGIILSSQLAANMGKDIGDTVTLRMPGGSADLTVVGIVEFPLDQVWVYWETLARISGFSFDTISGGSPVFGMIPPEARQFIKYASQVQVNGGDPVFALGLAPSVASYLPFKEGGFVQPEQPGVMVSSALAARDGYAVGDTLTLASQQPGGATADYPVVGVFDLPPMLTGQGEGLPQEVAALFWRDLVALDAATIETEPEPAAYFINTNLKNPTAAELDDLSSDISNEMAAAGTPVFILNFVELTDMIGEIFFTIQAILSAVAGLIALVGALGLLTTLSMSVFERQKEIGVMRSIGAGSSTVALQFLTEGLVVGIIAWLVGLPLMFLIQAALLAITGFGDTFPLEFSPAAAIIGLIGMLIITTVASLWPSLGAARRTVSDILRYQ